MDRIIKSDYFGKAHSIETMVSARILSKLEGLKGAYAVTADVIDVKIECFEGYCKINGKINFKILVNDSVEKIAPLNYNAEFSERYEIEIKPNTKLGVEAVASDAKAEILSGKEVEVSAKVEIKLIERVHNEIELKPIAKDILTKPQTYAIGRICADISTEFVVTHETELKNGAVKVLQADGVAVLKNASCNEGALNISGAIYMQLVCLNAENLPIVMLMPVDFDEELPAKDFCDGALPIAKIKACNVRVHIDVEDKDEITLNAEITINVSATCIEELPMQCVCDAYSTKNEVEITYSDIVGCKNYGMTNSNIAFNGEIDCHEQVAKVLGLYNSKVKIMTEQAGDNNVIIAGIAYGTLLYLNMEESIRSMPFELPFSATQQQEITSDCAVSISAAVTNAAIKRNGTNVSVNGAVTAAIYLSKNVTERIITDVVALEPKAENQRAIEAVIANIGDDPWSIGKSLNMSIDEVLALNPELKETLTKPIKVVIYRQL
ncbi:MAG: hypothetical protein RR316_03740 [Clostridia bacterium]